MSEIKIIVRDAKESLSGTLHASDGDRLVAALAAEPVTLADWPARSRVFGVSNRNAFLADFGLGSMMNCGTRACW